MGVFLAADPVETSSSAARDGRYLLETFGLCRARRDCVHAVPSSLRRMLIGNNDAVSGMAYERPWRGGGFFEKAETR